LMLCEDALRQRDENANQVEIGVNSKLCVLFVFTKYHYSMIKIINIV
jgi:hypothetical protein